MLTANANYQCQKNSPAHCVPLKAAFLGVVCFALRNAAIRIIKLEWNLTYRNNGRREEKWESKLHLTEVCGSTSKQRVNVSPPFLTHPCPDFGMRSRILISFSGFEKVLTMIVTNACGCDFFVCLGAFPLKEGESCRGGIYVLPLRAWVGCWLLHRLCVTLVPSSL